jgi:hypothetical protein
LGLAEPNLGDWRSGDDFEVGQSSATTGKKHPLQKTKPQFDSLVATPGYGF